MKYTKKAWVTLEKIMAALPSKSNYWQIPSNDDMRGYKDYHFELGNDNPDGSITGSVYVSTLMSHVKRIGGFRIEPDGEVTTFTDLPNSARIVVGLKPLKYPVVKPYEHIPSDDDD